MVLYLDILNLIIDNMLHLYLIVKFLYNLVLIVYLTIVIAHHVIAILHCLNCMLFNLSFFFYIGLKFITN